MGRTAGRELSPDRNGRRPGPPSHRRPRERRWRAKAVAAERRGDATSIPDLPPEPPPPLPPEAPADLPPAPPVPLGPSGPATGLGPTTPGGGRGPRPAPPAPIGQPDPDPDPEPTEAADPVPPTVATPSRRGWLSRPRLLVALVGVIVAILIASVVAATTIDHGGGDRQASLSRSIAHHLLTPYDLGPDWSGGPDGQNQAGPSPDDAGLPPCLTSANAATAGFGEASTHLVSKATMTDVEETLNRGATGVDGLYASITRALASCGKVSLHQNGQTASGSLDPVHLGTVGDPAVAYGGAFTVIGDAPSASTGAGLTTLAVVVAERHGTLVELSISSPRPVESQLNDWLDSALAKV